MATIEARKNKAGTITSYRVEWYDNGVRRRQTLPTETDAAKWKHLLEAVKHDTKAAELALLREISRSPSFEDVANGHIERLINVREYTIKRYRGYIKNHFDGLGNLPVDQITEDDLIRWIQRMVKKGCSPKTVANVHGFVHAAMNSAVRRRLRPDNPCNGRLLPKDNATDDKAMFLTMDQVNLIINQADQWHQPMWRLLIGSGLRLGEATALTPSDFQLDAETPSVRITKAYQEMEDGWAVGAPKTKKARRTVALAPSTVEAIRDRVESAERGKPVFTISRDTLVYPQHRQWLDAWYDATKAAIANKDMPLKLEKRPRIHDIRHSHASMMIAGGMNLYELANRLGHESIITTTKTYGHLVPDAHFRAAAMVETALTKSIAS
ncbi:MULTISPECIES: tyrosine-type recombinase/integrase [Arthrobacter]|uniref:Site-specific integrase n=1 Tax=Arthrobacter terricola TaxID=2547396 RepID=A0A4R5K8F6_9MICC|nr:MULTISPECIES: tyrosine-type recombinase/integrase [Arthrobacter]MBT8163089.1 site-specific integrase [Arthrobacter sp. GN70]TDF88129.1 site-specific integrase [Arthrobacter terricola]